MISIAYLWIPIVILAALGQVLRNAMQRELTASLGTVGATHVRFLFGFPFAIVFFIGVMLVMRESVAWPSLTFWLWLVIGTMAQIAATGMMLAAMNERSFVVTTAYIKTEPILAALFGIVFLADHLTVWKMLAIVVATAGVVVTAVRPGGERSFGALRPTALGLAAAATFALSAVGYRGAILQVGGVSFVTAASFTLVLGLMLQTLVLTGYLLLRDRQTLRALFRMWKPSLLAGFLGAAASQFWFLGFALTSVANVRTLALIEVLFAQAIAYYTMKQRLSMREAIGIALIVAGVAALIAVQ
jgi:drug/metabolite transporter (DMT)-like permease